MSATSRLEALLNKLFIFLNLKAVDKKQEDRVNFALDRNFYFFWKYTRNVYKSTVETSVQCKLSKLKMDILSYFAPNMTKGIVIFSSKTN